MRGKFAKRGKLARACKLAAQNILKRFFVYAGVLAARAEWSAWQTC